MAKDNWKSVYYGMRLGCALLAQKKKWREMARNGEQPSAEALLWNGLPHPRKDALRDALRVAQHLSAAWCDDGEDLCERWLQNGDCVLCYINSDKERYELKSSGWKKFGQEKELRNEGAIFFRFPADRSGTGDAVPDTLLDPIGSAEGLEAVFRGFTEFESIDVGNEKLNRLLEVARKIDETSDDSVDPRNWLSALFGICEDEDRSDWLKKPNESRLECLTKYLGELAKEAGLDLDSNDGEDDRSGSTGGGGGTDTSETKPEEELAAWIESNGLCEEFGVESPGEFIKYVDGGFETITEWRKEKGRLAAGTRRYLLNRRLKSLKEYVDGQKKAGKNFERLAPVPSNKLNALKEKLEQSGTLRFPITNALWVVSRVRDAFPECFASGEMKIENVGLVGAKNVEGEKQRQRNENIYCPLFRRSETNRFANPLTLRKFGEEIIEEWGGNRRGTHYWVEIEFESTDGDSNPPCLQFPFQWVHKVQEVSFDLGPLRRSREALNNLPQQDNDDDLVNVLEELEAAAKNIKADEKNMTIVRQGVLNEVVPVFCNDHDGSVKFAHPTIFDSYLLNYQKALRKFGELFDDCGEWAPRIASRSLDSFLKFGITTPKRDSEIWQVEPYHPLRIRRLFEIEQYALNQIEALVTERGSLREVPLDFQPPFDEAPTVVWFDKFLVADGFKSDDPCRLRFSPFRGDSGREKGLTKALAPVIRRYVRALFPGFKSRLQIRLCPSSRMHDPRPPLRLAANLAKTGWKAADNKGTESCVDGVDFFVGEADDSDESSSDERTLTVDTLGEDIESVRAAETLARLLESDDHEEEDDDIFWALEKKDSSDPRFRLEVFREAPKLLNEGREWKFERHLGLLVQPWSIDRLWVTRDAGSASGLPQTREPVWESVSRSWTNLRLSVPVEIERGGARALVEEQESNGGAGAHEMERHFQHLLVRRWRRESDEKRRVLGLALETDGKAYASAQRLWKRLDEALQSHGRVILVDDVFGAEAFDEKENAEEFRVCWADYDYRQGRKITILGSTKENRPAPAPKREVEKFRVGLSRLYEDEISDDYDDFIERAYEAVHRAAPEVLNEFWQLADLRYEPTKNSAEKLGHLAAALFVNPERAKVNIGSDQFTEPFPSGTILLSMDKLQKWTTTRSGGTRGDFIAVAPPSDESENAPVRIIAIEVKGSLTKNHSKRKAQNQAEASRGKLEDTFGVPENRAQRRKLLDVLALQSFRARDCHSAAHDALAEADNKLAHSNEVDRSGLLQFSAVALSALGASQKSGRSLEHEYAPRKAVDWIGVWGLDGMRALAGT